MGIEIDALFSDDPSLDPVERARSLAESLRRVPSLAVVADLLDVLASALEAERRRLVRLGFDLHDGALQDIVALGTDIHLFREQLSSVETNVRRRIVGRVDDLIARLTSVDTQLRALATLAESSSLLRRPFSVTLKETVASYTDHGVSVEVSLDDTLDETPMTDSQRIALLRVVQGSLANVVRHSGASNASVTVRELPDAIEAAIRDDGCGFSVQPTLSHAVETGRLGLVGMRERARLLGGTLNIESAPGGPTTVHLRLPRWRDLG